MSTESLVTAPGWDPGDGPWSAVPRTTLTDYFATRLRAGGDRPAVVFDDGAEIRRDELLEHSERLAAGLADCVEPGDRVAVAVGNRAEFFVALFALAAVRAVAVTISPAVGEHDARTRSTTPVRGGARRRAAPPTFWPRRGRARA